jgi:drug/metabolite transporter (DMT)-like permease
MRWPRSRCSASPAPRWRSCCWHALVSEIGPGRALVITYVNPVVAVALGVVVLGERIGTGAVAGLLLIIAGSWLSTDGRLPPRLLTLARSARRSQQVRGY